MVSGVSTVFRFIMKLYSRVAGKSTRKGTGERGKKEVAGAFGAITRKFFTQRTQRRKERKVVVRGHSVCYQEKTGSKDAEGGKKRITVRGHSAILQDSSCSTIIWRTTTLSLFPLRSLRLGVLCVMNWK